MRTRDCSQTLGSTGSAQEEPQSSLSESSGSSTPPAPAPQPAEAPRLDQQEDAGDSSDSRDGGTGEEVASCSSSESDEAFAEVLNRVKEVLRLDAEPQAPLSPRASPLASLDLEGIAHYISSGRARNIVCLCGAGISVSAGIPDFRTPGTGLYHRLAEYSLPYPQAIFEIDFFKRNPMPFYTLARELYPGTFHPTPAHFFLKLLAERGLLLRCYTQNIDSLEVAAGLPPDLVIPAHGNFDSASCVACDRSYDPAYVREALFGQADGSVAIPHCSSKGCKGLVKPDIVMFGEGLPARFWSSLAADFAAADLLIVMGTSLVVQPFASLIDRVGEGTPRLLINRERVGEGDPALRAVGWRKGFEFPPRPTAWRDVAYLGDCDAGVQALAALLGYAEELEAMVGRGRGRQRAPQGPAPEERLTATQRDAEEQGARRTLNQP